MCHHGSGSNSLPIEKYHLLASDTRDRNHYLNRGERFDAKLFHPKVRKKEKFFLPSIECNYKKNNNHKEASSKQINPHFKPGVKRKRAVPQEEKQKLTHCKNEIRDADLEKWLEMTKRFPDSRWRIKEKRALKSWFDQLDRNGNGEIDVEELSDPLLSTGLAKNVAEVKNLVQMVDEDKSGAIGFKEFLKIMRSKEEDGKVKYNASSSTIGLPRIKRSECHCQSKKNSKEGDVEQGGPKETVHEEEAREKNIHQVKEKISHRKASLNPIVKLQTLQEQKGDMNINIVLSQQRRKLLLDATMGEAVRREKALDKIGQWKMEIKDTKGAVSKFHKLNDIAKLTKKMESDQNEKANFVTAMRGMLTQALDGEKNNEGLKKIGDSSPSPSRKNGNKKRNVMILASRERDGFGMVGGRHALLYPRTSSPSLPFLSGASFLSPSTRSKLSSSSMVAGRRVSFVHKR